MTSLPLVPTMVAGAPKHVGYAEVRACTAGATRRRAAAARIAESLPMAFASFLRLSSSLPPSRVDCPRTAQEEQGVRTQPPPRPWSLGFAHAQSDRRRVREPRPRRARRGSPAGGRDDYGRHV